LAPLIEEIEKNELDFHIMYNITYYDDYILLVFKDGRHRHGCNAIIVEISKVYHAIGLAIRGKNKYGELIIHKKSSVSMLVKTDDIEQELTSRCLANLLVPTPLNSVVNGRFINYIDGAEGENNEDENNEDGNNEDGNNEDGIEYQEGASVDVCCLYSKIMKFHDGRRYRKNYTHMGYKDINDMRLTYQYVHVDQDDNRIILKHQTMSIEFSTALKVLCEKYYTSNGPSSYISPFVMAEKKMNYLLNKLLRNNELNKYYVRNERIDIMDQSIVVFKLNPSFKFNEYSYVSDIITVGPQYIDKIVGANAIKISAIVGGGNYGSICLKYISYDCQSEKSFYISEMYYGPNKKPYFTNMNDIITALLRLVE
jgi:hypothetical protein